MIESVDDVVALDGKDCAGYLLPCVVEHARARGVELPRGITTPYINTIPVSEEPEPRGDLTLERRIRAIMRWNAMAMVSRANKHFEGIGGHISTYASSALLYEIGFNHFFRGKDADGGGDHVLHSRPCRRPASTRAPSSKDASAKSSCEHFRRETGAAAAFRRIRTPV